MGMAQGILICVTDTADGSLSSCLTCIFGIDHITVCIGIICTVISVSGKYYSHCITYILMLDDDINLRCCRKSPIVIYFSVCNFDILFAM